jgi:hypothetical protein
LTIVDRHYLSIARLPLWDCASATGIRLYEWVPQPMLLNGEYGHGSFYFPLFRSTIGLIA